MLRLTTILMLALVLSGYTSSGQPTHHVVDTVNIYENDAGIRFKTYMYFWFWQYGGRNRYSWNTRLLNKQDSMVIIPHLPRYFKVYDNHERLMFEGLSIESELVGDIKFYYKSGQLKRIEHWDQYQEDTTCKMLEVQINYEVPGPEGTWKYFRKNGSLKKQLEYLIEVESCEPLDYCVARKTIKYKKNGEIRSVRQKADCNSA